MRRIIMLENYLFQPDMSDDSMIQDQLMLKDVYGFKFKYKRILYFF